MSGYQQPQPLTQGLGFTDFLAFFMAMLLANVLGGLILGIIAREYIHASIQDAMKQANPPMQWQK